MPIQSRDTRSSSRTVRLTDEEGKTHEVCHVTGSIRDGRSVSIVVDVFEASVVTENLQDVREQVMTFVSAVFADAQQTGVPVCPMSEAE